MPKSYTHLLEVSKQEEAAPRSPSQLLEALMSAANSLPPGSDVDGFLEAELAALAASTRETVAQQRADAQHAASQEAGFSPSGMPEVRGANAPGSDGAAPCRDDLGPDQL